jgi:hypothetical protein
MTLKQLHYAGTFSGSDTYRGICSCGWIGERRVHLDDARTDAEQHREANGGMLKLKPPPPFRFSGTGKP